MHKYLNQKRLFAGILRNTLLLYCALIVDAASTEYGKGTFVGNLVLREHNDNSFDKYELVEDLKYIDSERREWFAWKGTVTDGASIPRFLWTVIGSPYTGNYRRAAVIHDFYYTNLFRYKEDVDEMFYDAMISDGVVKAKALLMYYAVVRFGKRWSIDEIVLCPPGRICNNPGSLDLDILLPTLEEKNMKAYKSEMQEIELKIQEDNLDIEEVKSIAMSKVDLKYVLEEKKITDNWNDNIWRNK